MGTGYTRNDTANNIADGNVINASDLDGEFDAIQAAFNATTGHSHDGTTGEGPQITAAGIANNAVALGTKTTGNYVATITAGTGISGNATGEGSTPTISVALNGLTTSTTDGDGDYFVVVNDSGGQRKLTKANIAVSGFNTANGIALGTDTTGNYIATGAVSGVGLSGSASAEGATFTVTSNATSANTASTIVARSSSGNFSAGTITAALSGNASTATTWQTARSLTLSGDVTGTATGINGSGNIAVTTTIAANSVALGTDTTGNYVSTITGGTGIDSTGATSGEGIAHTLNLDLNELPTSTANTDGDYFVVVDSADGSQHKLTKANIALSGMNNDAGWTSNVGDITGVTAGTNLTGGGTSGTVTLNMATGGVGAGTYGSTADDTKIDTITVDAYGRVTAVATGNTGDIRNVVAGDGLTGGGTSDAVTLNVGAGTGVTVAADTVSIGQDVATTASPSFGGLNINGNINAVDDIYLADQIIHEGDTDTYIQFVAANEMRVVTGGSENIRFRNAYIQVYENVQGSVETASKTGSVTPDMQNYNSFVWTLTGNITLNNPTTELAGSSGVFIFIHSGAARTVSLGTDWETAGGAGLTLSSTAGAVDIVPYFVQAGSNILLGTPQLGFV